MRHLIRRGTVLAGALALLLGTGTGVAAAAPGGPGAHAVLTFDPGSHEFGSAAGAETFELVNTGERNSGGVKVTLDGSAEFTITANDCRGNLHVGEMCEVTVAFTPTSGAKVETTLEAHGNPHTISGTADLTGGTTATPVNCTTHPDTALQHAISAAADGAVLAVSGECVGNFTISKPLALTGHGESPTLKGPGTGRALHIIGVSVTLTGLTITNGSTSGDGGGIYNVGGTLILDDSSISGNTAGVGGGIYNADGEVILDDSSITGNTAGFIGGGIANFGTVIMNSTSSISGNEVTAFFGFGGGIYNSGTVTGATSTNITGNEPDNCAGEPVPGCVD